MTEEDAKPADGQGGMNGGRPYTLEGLAERWECTGAHVRRLCNSGKLRHFKIGNLYRIPVDAVLEFEIGNYGDGKPAATAAMATPLDKEDPVASYVRSFRERMSGQATAPVLPLPIRAAKEE